MEEDIPPQWMWCFSDELAEWFKEVRASKGQPPAAKDDREEVPMIQNELVGAGGRV